MASFRRQRTAPEGRISSSWSSRRVMTWTLFGSAAVIAVQHLLAHGGFRPVPLSMGWQDVLMGYPTAILLAIVGGIVMDPNPRI